MKKIITVMLCIVLVLLFAGCGKDGDTSKVEIDYGTSSVYSKEEIDSAIEIIKKQFALFEGCELHRLSYMTDEECNNADNIEWMPDDFDIENYTKEVFFMFSGEKVLVDLRCDNSLMKTMVDRFGEDVTTLAYDMTSFRVQTEVSASPTFFGWVFGFNGKVQILAPERVKEQYRQMIAKADENMQESE